MFQQLKFANLWSNFPPYPSPSIHSQTLKCPPTGEFSLRTPELMGLSVTLEIK